MFHNLNNFLYMVWFPDKEYEVAIKIHFSRKLRNPPCNFRRFIKEEFLLLWQKRRLLYRGELCYLRAWSKFPEDNYPLAVAAW